MTPQELEKLKEAAIPLIKYMNDLHPHHVAIVTSTSIQLFEGVASIPKIYEFIKD